MKLVCMVWASQKLGVQSRQETIAISRMGLTRSWRAALTGTVTLRLDDGAGKTYNVAGTEL